MINGAFRGIASGAAAGGGGGGGLLPLTLNPALASNPAYQYYSFNDNYLGAFRITADPGGEGLGTMRFGDGAIAYNPDNNSLFISGHDTDGCIIAEFNIPASFSTSTTLTDLPIATVRQQCVRARDRGTGLKTGLVYEVKPAGLYYNSGRLMISVYGQYSQSPNFDTQYLVFRDANNLDTSAVDGWMLTPNPMAACGSVAPIPAEYQSALGGTHITGFSNSTDKGSTQALSSGPAAYSFSPNAILTDSATIGTGTLSINRLMHYPLYGILAPTDNHLYNDDNAGSVGGTVLDPPSAWTHLAETNCAVVIPGTNSLLSVGGYAGFNSGGWYGSGPSLDQGHHPNDPDDALPFYWITSLDDLADVHASVVSYDAVEPIEYAPFTIPFFDIGFNAIGGIAVDEAGSRMFVTLRGTDTSDGYARPMVLVFSLPEVS